MGGYGGCGGCDDCEDRMTSGDWQFDFDDQGWDWRDPGCDREQIKKKAREEQEAWMKAKKEKEIKEKEMREKKYCTWNGSNKHERTDCVLIDV
jgi:hypothetical protein